MYTDSFGLIMKTNIVNGQMDDINSLSTLLRGSSSTRPKIYAQKKAIRVSNKRTSQKETGANSSCNDNDKTKNGAKLTAKANEATASKRLSGESIASNSGLSRSEKGRIRKRDESNPMTDSEVEELYKVLKKLPALTVEHLFEAIQRCYYHHVAGLENWPNNLGILPPFIQWELQNKTEDALLKVQSSPPERTSEESESAETDTNHCDFEVGLEEEILVENEAVQGNASTGLEDCERNKEVNSPDENKGKDSTKDEEKEGQDIVDDNNDDIDLN